MKRVVLASGSKTRRMLLEKAGVSFDVEVPGIDEESLTAALREDGATARSIAEVIAEYKSRKISARRPRCLVIGCDQVLEFNGQTYGKCKTQGEARQFLQMLRGERHKLHSAAVIYERARPVWRHIGTAELRAAYVDDSFLDEYLAGKGDQILGSVGCYHIEDTEYSMVSIERGEVSVVMGLPLSQLLGYLVERGIVNNDSK